MKIAVFGDVHGNRFALDAVVQDIERHQPDAWVNLGDQLFGGADPAGAWALQQELKARHGVLEVRGNTDERLGEELTATTAKRSMLEWLHGVLPERAGAYVAALPTSVTLADGMVLAAHGSPDSAWTYLLRDGDSWAGDDAVRVDLYVVPGVVCEDVVAFFQESSAELERVGAFLGVVGGVCGGNGRGFKEGERGVGAAGDVGCRRWRW